MVAFAGIPVTAITLLAAVVGLVGKAPSGIATLIVPEVNVALPGTGGTAEPTVKATPLIPATPPQTGPTGVIGKTGRLLTVSVAAFDVNAGLQIPVTIQRYLFPLKIADRGLMVNVGDVAPLYGAPLARLFQAPTPRTCSCHW